MPISGFSDIGIFLQKITGSTVFLSVLSQVFFQTCRKEFNVLTVLSQRVILGLSGIDPGTPVFGGEMFDKGTVINERYEIKELIGAGGTSQVYLVSDKHIGRQLAMKVMPRDRFGAARFAKSEIESLRSVHYPLFPDIHDAFCDSGNIFIVSDYVRGVSLWQLCKGEGIAKSQCLYLAGRICEALIYLHGMASPMLYLDLKPDNIIVSEDGQPHLIDFGIACRIAGGRLPVGTPGYSPPEQHVADGKMDARTDIFAFGMTYYCMRHGIPPDPDADKALYNIRHSKRLSRPERSFLTKCCAISKEDRYKTASEVLRQISNIRSTPYRFKKRTVAFAIATGATLAAVCGGKVLAGKISRQKYAAQLVNEATQHMEDGYYTPEGIGIIKAYINSGNLPEECEQEFIFEVAACSMLVSKDYRTAAAYFARLDSSEYPEAADYIKLCLLQNSFDHDPETAVDVTGKLFTQIVRQAPSKMKYENMIFVADCYENYDPERTEGIIKALSVLKIAREELAGVNDREDMTALAGRIDDLIAVKEKKLKIEKKGEIHEKE